MDSLPKRLRFGAFLLSNAIGALVFFLGIYIIFRLEDVAAGEIPEIDLTEILTDAYRSHWHTLIVWVSIVLVVMLWRRHVLIESRKQEQLLESILNAAADGIYMTDRAGRVTYVNPATEKMVGLKRAEIVQRKYNDDSLKITTLDGKPFPEQGHPFVRIMQTGEAVHGIEQIIHRPDGRQVIVSINAAPLWSEDGELAGEVGAMTDITERKRVEAEHLKFALGIERTADAVFITDTNGTIVYVNPAFEKIYGYTRDEAIGHTPRLIKSGLLGKAVYERFWQTLLKREIVAGEIINKTKSGQLVTIESSASPIIDERGNLIGFLGIQRDISERKRAEATLRDSETRYRSLFENMLNGFAYCQMLFEDAQPVDFIYLAVNKAFEESTGLKEVIGKRVTEIIPGIRESNPELFEIYGRVALSGKAEKFETYVPALQMWFSISAYSPLKEHFVAVFDDITERKRAEEALRQSEEQFRSIFQTASDAIIVANSEGAIIAWNQGAEKIFQYSPEQVLGQPVTILMPARYHASHTRGLIRTHASETHLHGKTKELWGLRKDGTEFPLEIAICAWDGTEGKAYGAVIRDITERKHSEQVLRESEDRYRDLYDKAPIAYYSVDAQDGRIRMANQRMAEMLGYSLTDLIGRPIFDVYADTPFGQEKARQIFQRFRAGEEIGGEQVQMLTAQGMPLWVSISVQAVRDASGQVIHSRAMAQDISQRKRAEEALAEERNLLRTVIDFLPYEIFMKDLESRYIALNQMQADVLGVTSTEQAIGKTAFDYFPEELAAQYHLDDLKIMQTGQPMLDQERRRKSLDGRERWRLVSKVPLRDTSGNVIGVVGIGRDITERKKAEEEILRRNKELAALNKIGQALNYRASPSEILELIYVMINSLLDNRNLYVALYDDASQQISFPVYTIDGERRTPAARPPRNGITEYILRTKKPLLIPNHMDAKMQELGIDLIGQPARCFLGVPLLVGDKAIGVMALQDYEKENAYTGRDVELLSTFAAQAAIALDNAYLVSALQQSETKYRNIFENAIVGIYQTSPDGKWLTANSSLARMLGYESPAQLMDQLSDLNRQFYVEPTRRVEFVRQMEERDIVVGFESEVYRRDGSVIWISENARSVHDADGKRVAFEGTTIDITERKQVDQLKSEFVSVVSHELRTPLTSIRGSLGLIAGGVAGQVSPKAKSLVDIAHKNSERLVLLINDILDIDKIESGKMVFDNHPIELMPLLHQAIEANCAYASQYEVELSLKNSLAEAKVNADQGRLSQVLTNLISNAAKFSPRGGLVEIGASRLNSHLRVTVTDQGAGIPEEFQSRIFQKFAQADSSTTRQRGGTGLGLSICKAIIEKLGGHIGFETRANAGTTFFFDLPEWHEQEVEPARIARPHLLICEDDRDTATLLQLLLEQAGYGSDIAYDATQAKELLKKNHYAGMTLDLVLPDQDGISLMQELREQNETRDLPVIVVSVRAEQGRTSLNGDAVQVIDWISKPIDSRRLIDAVRCAAAHVSKRAHLLHIEDDADVLQVARLMLQDVATVDCARSLEEARRRLRQEHYDLAILDLEMPDGSGLELVPLLQEQSPPVPIVVFSVDEINTETAVKVSAVLVKSRTSNEKLVDTICSLVQARQTIHSEVQP